MRLFTHARTHLIKAVAIKSMFRHAKRETLSFDLDFFPIVLIVHGSMSVRNGSVMLQVYWITDLANQQLSVDHLVLFAFYVSLFLFSFCFFIFFNVFIIYFFSSIFSFTSCRGTKIFFLIIFFTVAFYTIIMIMTLLVVVIINNHNNQ